MIKLITQRITLHMPDLLEYISEDQLNITENFLPPWIKDLQINQDLSKMHGKAFDPEELKQLIADPENQIQGVPKFDFFKLIFHAFQKAIDQHHSGIIFYNQEKMGQLQQVMPNTIFSFKMAEFEGCRDESIYFAEKMKAADFKVMYSIVRGASHDFPFFSSILEGFNHTWQKAQKFVEQEILDV